MASGNPGETLFLAEQHPLHSSSMEQMHADGNKGTASARAHVLPTAPAPTPGTRTERKHHNEWPFKNVGAAASVSRAQRSFSCNFLGAYGSLRPRPSLLLRPSLLRVCAPFRPSPPLSPQHSFPWILSPALPFPPIARELLGCIAPSSVVLFQTLDC